jgi:hypothetical protein
MEIQAGPSCWRTSLPKVTGKLLFVKMQAISMKSDHSILTKPDDRLMTAIEVGPFDVGSACGW